MDEDLDSMTREQLVAGMPRYARLHAPGALVHVIGRFVKRAFRRAGPLEHRATRGAPEPAP